MKILLLVFQRNRLKRILEVAHDSISLVLEHLPPQNSIFIKIIEILSSVKEVIESFGENFLGMDFEAHLGLTLGPEESIRAIEEKINNLKKEIG